MFQCSLLSVFADDEYTYTVTFYAGNQGTFADGAGKIVMSNLKYGAFVSFDVQKDGVVTLNNSDKYYVKGLRKSGRDNSETDELEASRYSVTVKGDADYVVAYGIKGNQVAYTVNYQDADGKELLASNTYYGNVGDKPVVAYQYVEGYTPQALALTKTLSENSAENVFTFRYTPIGTTVVTIPGETTTVTTVVPGTTNVETITVPATTSAGTTTGTTTGTTGTGTTGTGTTGTGTTGTGTGTTTGTGTGTSFTKQSPGTGDTTDSADKSSESSTSEQGKEFYTIQTASEKVFYLVIDRDGDEEKVYFLTEVSENDLLNTTSDNSETLPKNSAALESAIPVKDAALDNNNTDATGNKKQDAETVEENTEDSTEEGSEPETTEQKQDGSGFSYLIMGIAVAAVIGVVYVIKAKKKKENFIDDDEDELEDDYEEDYDDEDGEEADPDEEFMKNTNAEETNTENEEE